MDNGYLMFVIYILAYSRFLHKYSYLNLNENRIIGGVKLITKANNPLDPSLNGARLRLCLNSLNMEKKTMAGNWQLIINDIAMLRKMTQMSFVRQTLP